MLLLKNVVAVVKIYTSQLVIEEVTILTIEMKL